MIFAIMPIIIRMITTIIKTFTLLKAKQKTIKIKDNVTNAKANIQITH